MSSGVLGSTLSFDRGGLAAAESPNVGPDRLDRAVNTLRRIDPAMSASGPIATWQLIALYGLASLLPIAAVFVPAGHGGIFAAILSLPFVCIIVVRIAAVLQLIVVQPDVAASPPPLADADLPVYSVLVPLFRERDVVPALVEALRALNYPPDKLDILFVTEEIDTPTRKALDDTGLDAWMRVISVPCGVPQTKPRALSYAMQFICGTLVTVYDAEDVPSPFQLRRAAERFNVSSDDVVCLQARLGIYNTERSFYSRQFTLEYAALFEAILPVMQRFGWPVLLGGTSNHFRRQALEDVGGWDPFNVAEDADLGVRLARFGRRVGMLDSDTWEEAPSTRQTWEGQRTRWLKGWMQTYLVHMRDPKRLWQELGAWQFFGLQITLGGMILSALVHPWFYVAAAYQLYFGLPMVAGSAGLWALCWFNLGAGYAAGIVLGLISARRSQGRVPVISALLIPFYWLAISWASYRALIELFLRPYYWQKTPHSARPVTLATAAS